MPKNIIKFAIILTIATVVIVTSVYLITRRPKIVYQYDEIKSGKITETVNVSGQIKAAESIDLSFERPGKISRKYAAVGDKVKADQVLLTLDNGDVAAQLAKAQAALDRELAGNRPEYIAQLSAALKQAEANLTQVSAVADNSIHAAEAVRLTAENNLKLAEGGESSQIVEDAYENMATLLESMQSTLTNALDRADSILGIDIVSANDEFENLLSVEDLKQLSLAKSKYAQAKIKQQDFSESISLLTSSDHNRVVAAAGSADVALAAVRDLLDAVASVLDNTITSADLSSGELNAMKLAVQNARTDVTAKIIVLTNQRHAVDAAKNSYTTYKIAFDKANHDLRDIKNKSVADIAAAQAALDKAQAALADAENPPREVDVAGLRAAVYAARANYNKTVLSAPFDGTISRQDGEPGALAMANAPLISMFSDGKYQIETHVPETDLPKIKTGDPAMVTLDNISGNSVFPAQVIKIYPAADQPGNGIAAYKVILQFTNEDERLAIGLTANVKIIGDEKDNVLIIPARDVVQKNNEYFALVLNNKIDTVQKPITIGLKGEAGQWEVGSGLAAGDLVIGFSASK